jgi:hypothetical protein
VFVVLMQGIGAVERVRDQCPKTVTNARSVPVPKEELRKVQGHFERTWKLKRK